MTEPVPEPEVWDAPNQQVVRPDESPPWEEGEGGTTHEPPREPPGEEIPVNAETASVDLDGMTKDQLLEYAQSLGITPANASMTKDELRQGIDQHQGR